MFEPLKSPWWTKGDLEEVTANTVLPFSVQELKDFLKITNDDEDRELERVLRESMRFVQFDIARAITTWTLRLHLDGFPMVIELPYPPLQGSVTSILYTDVNGVEQTLASVDYQVQAVQDRVRIIPAYGESWPSTRTQYSAVKVNYIAGYASETSVRDDVKAAIKWKVKLMREDQLSGTIARELRDGYDRIVNSLRRVA